MADDRLDETIAKLRAERLNGTRYDRPYAWGWVVFGLGCLGLALFAAYLMAHVSGTGAAAAHTVTGPALVSAFDGSYCEVKTADGVRPLTVPDFDRLPQYVAVDPGPAGSATLTCTYPVQVAQGAAALLPRMYGNHVAGVAVAGVLFALGRYFGPRNARRMRQRRLGTYRSRPGVLEQALIKQRAKETGRDKRAKETGRDKRAEEAGRDDKGGRGSDG